MSNDYDFDFKLYEHVYGDMYHLILDRPLDKNNMVRFVSSSDKQKYATVDNKPIFFSWDKEFRIATDYIILYPKVYVKKSIKLLSNRSIVRSYIH